MRKYVLAILLAVLPCSAMAEDVSLQVLAIESGIRNFGMGTTGVSGVNRMPNAYYNPAAVAWADGIAGAFETQLLEVFSLEFDITDARVTFGTGVVERGWRFGGELAYRRLHYDFSGVSITDDYYSGAFSVAYLANHLAASAGLSAKRGTISDIDADASFESLDLGVVLAFPVLVSGSILQPRVGVSVANFDNGFDFDGTTYGIRNVTRAGAGIDLFTPKHEWAGRQVSRATASLDVDYAGHEDSDDSSWATGFEVGIFELVYLRAGYEWGPGDDYTVRRLGAGLGWEMGRWFARADYAHEDPDERFFEEDLGRDMYGIILGARI